MKTIDKRMSALHKEVEVTVEVIKCKLDKLCRFTSNSFKVFFIINGAIFSILPAVRYTTECQGE